MRSRTVPCCAAWARDTRLDDLRRDDIHLGENEARRLVYVVRCRRGQYPDDLRADAGGVDGNGLGYVAWTTTAGVMWGARFEPMTGTWGSQVQLSSTAVYMRPAVALTSTLGIVAGVRAAAPGGRRPGRPLPGGRGCVEIVAERCLHRNRGQNGQSFRE